MKTFPPYPQSQVCCVVDLLETLGFHTWYNYTGLEFMDNKLDRIEKYIQHLIEDQLVRIIAGDQPSLTLIERLMDVLQQHLRKDPDGTLKAPDLFFIHVNPEELPQWLLHQETLNQMAVLLHEKGGEEGLFFATKPEIRVQNDAQIAKGDFLITTGFSPRKAALPETAAIPPISQEPVGNRVPREAYMIIQGVENFPLTAPVINIGRHSDNDLILPDPHISRHHAQLRVIHQRYVIFDAGSTGGVLLNGKPITQATLRSGDVLRLGATNLIYVQEPSTKETTTAFSPGNDGQEQ